MYGNGINNPFIMSNMYNPIGSSTMHNMPMMNSTTMMGGPVRRGLLSSLFGGRGTAGLSQGIKTFNFGNILNNTSKALGVVREAIPIVKEVGPMFGNMKQILKIASVFKDETDITTNIRNNNSVNNTIKTNTNTTTQKEKDTNIISTTINTRTNNNEPNFFL